jgi:hypothetical protein
MHRARAPDLTYEWRAGTDAQGRRRGARSCCGTYHFDGNGKWTPAAALLVGLSLRLDRSGSGRDQGHPVPASVPGRLRFDVGYRVLYLGDTPSASPRPSPPQEFRIGLRLPCARPEPPGNAGKHRGAALIGFPVAAIHRLKKRAPQSWNGSRTRMVSSRSGLVESNATGHSISSSMALTYLTA